MAKSKSFFGLRTGSTKSATFSVFRGQQITKDRVEKISNPQTSAQMLQRMKLAQVAAAAARLEGLVNHSFEGVDYGYKSVADFRRRNLENGALSIKQYIPKGMADAGVADYVISSGSLVPFSYEISSRFSSLVSSFDTYEFFQALGNVDGVGSKKLSQIPTASVWKALFDANPYLLPGDQITFLMQYPYINGSYTWKSKSGLTNNAQNRTGFVIGRFILPHVIDNEGNYGYTSEETEIMDDWKIILKPGDGKPNTVDLDNGFIGVSSDTPSTFTNFSNPVSLITFGDGLDQVFDNDPYAGCVILSRKDTVKDVWRRSSARLAINETLTGNYAKCDYTYLKSNATSNKYLNTGDQNTGILGQQVTDNIE